MANVKLEHVSKVYDKGKKVIDDVSIEIKDKEFLVLVGSSGCGKSTILRMIAGLEDITSGKIIIGERIVNNIHPKDRDISFVFQNYALYPHMSVYDNMAFPLKMRKYKKAEIDSKVREAADFLDLTEVLERKPKQLSGGQRQRVALGRAIVREPKVFLMDEPLSNLDAKLRAKTRAELKRLHESLQATFIYVTHDQTEALTLGDRIAVIDKGIIQQVDTPEVIYNYPANKFVGGFLGSPPMNFIKGKIEDNKVRINGEIFELNEEQKELLTGREEIYMGIRSEKFNEAEGNFTFRAKVRNSEMLGSKKIVYTECNEGECLAEMPANMDYREEITLRINTNNILYFDTETEKLIKNKREKDAI